MQLDFEGMRIIISLAGVVVSDQYSSPFVYVSANLDIAVCLHYLYIGGSHSEDLAGDKNLFEIHSLKNFRISIL